MLVTCQACGAENDDEARYCDQCAAPLAAALLENSAGTPALVICPHCRAQNPSGANFCNQCATPLTTGPSATGPSSTGAAAGARPAVSSAPARAGNAVNWLGLGLLALVVAFIGWMTLGGGKSTAGTPDGSTAPAGGGDPGQVFGQVQGQLKQLKEALGKDPADGESIKKMYELYGQIGRGTEVGPYLDKALAEVDARVSQQKLTAEDASKLVLDLSIAAMNADDTASGIKCLKAYYKYKPERVSTAKMLGDIYYDSRDAPGAIEWYTNYVTAADPAKEGVAYYNAMVDRATMRMQLAEAGQPAMLTQAIAELQQVIKARPDLWAAHFNLGQALLQSGDKAAAERKWNECGKLAKTPEETWRTQAALATLHGQPAPPRPAGMEDSNGSASASAMEPGEMPSGANPHGAMTSPPPGTPNPHDSPTFGQGVAGH
jgi:tetratricopeptide (TPR) repeat protein